MIGGYLMFQYMWHHQGPSPRKDAKLNWLLLTVFIFMEIRSGCEYMTEKNFLDLASKDLDLKISSGE